MRRAVAVVVVALALAGCDEDSEPSACEEAYWCGYDYGLTLEDGDSPHDEGADRAASDCAGAEPGTAITMVDEPQIWRLTQVAGDGIVDGYNREGEMHTDWRVSNWCD